MSYWQNLKVFVKKVLHRDDDYPLCKSYIEDCNECPKKETCKKASRAEYFKNEPISKEISTSSENDKFTFSYNDQELVIKFGSSSIVLSDDSITLTSSTIYANGNFGCKNGAKQGYICLFTRADVKNGIVTSVN